MASPTKLQHPLLRHPGSSQRKRRVNAFALKSGYAPIDSRSLADILDYIHNFARLLVFPEFKQEGDHEGQIQLSNWVAFFDKSLPFQLVRFSKIQLDQLEETLQRISHIIEQDPTAENLQFLLDFGSHELIDPFEKLQKQVLRYEFGLKAYLLRTIEEPLWDYVARFILLSNTSGKYFCVGKKNFVHFTQVPWSIPIDDIFAVDATISGIPGGKKGAVLWLKEELKVLLGRLLSTLRQICNELPNYLEDSLEVLQKQHEPHLGLLFTFIHLFKFFQRDQNQLTQKHLDFYYKQILQFKPKEFTPDKTHLIFEIAKHLNSYPVKNNFTFKDGKDLKNEDIIFNLDDEIIIDKAQIVNLKTLYLNHVQGKLENDSPTRNFVDGLYIASVANSADGKGGKFKEEQSKNWAALGAKFSKFIAPGNEMPDTHSLARMGFVLSSPVLWLNEGTRKVIIEIKCDDGGNKDVFMECFDHYKNFLNKEFYQITDQSITKIEGIFSVEAKAFLQEKLDKKKPFLIEENLQDFLNSHLPNQKKFTEYEKNLLLFFLENIDEGFLLYELPFDSLIKYFNQLLLQKNPYPIGYDVEDFLSQEDAVTCKPLLKKLSEEDKKNGIPNTIEILTKLLDKNIEKKEIFSVQFSGEEGWFSPKNITTFTLDKDKDPIELTFMVQLDPLEPAVAFFDSEAIEENFRLEHPYPLVKIELNPEIQLECMNSDHQDVDCCLANRNKPMELRIALYQFFRHLKIQEVNIDVEVCGVKQLVVQNEESLQDVNSPMLPFGTRPKVGSEFFIGSKEVFYKNWKEIYLNLLWKDLPTKITEGGPALAFDDLYKDYYAGTNFEDESNQISNGSFELKTAILAGGIWIHENENIERTLFWEGEKEQFVFCTKEEIFSLNRHALKSSDYLFEFNRKKFNSDPVSSLSVNSQDAFLRLTLDGVSFQHDRYALVLSRHLMKLANLIDPRDIPNLVISVKVIKSLSSGIKEILNEIIDLIDKSNLSENCEFVIESILTYIENIKSDLSSMKDHIEEIKNVNQLQNVSFSFLQENIKKINDIYENLDSSDPISYYKYKKEIKELIKLIEENINKQVFFIDEVLKIFPDESTIETLGLPKEPYTPTIKSISIDYKASADHNDIELIHLYPFTNSSKKEYLSMQPTLLPTFTDEGSLFIGLESLRPGGSLQLLFQLAEATADSELDRAEIHWNYLSGNRWQPLRQGFEILSDETQKMTRSGIVKIAIPSHISTIGNTLMPPTDDGKTLFWLKVSTPDSAAAVAEIIGIHAQAASATFMPSAKNDLQRLAKELPPLQISKPTQPDFNIKKVEQPYESFGGKIPEKEGHYYIRVSEHLRHKGRSVDAFDYEHLILEEFPQLFKCKCISHTLGLSVHSYRRDLEVAPGFVIIAVIPDLTILKSGDLLEPKVPAGLLMDIKAFLKQKVSPFARIKVMNPRYEKIKVEITIRLMKGRDENFYTHQIKDDLRKFLSPWHLGDADKISFGQHLMYSDVIGFIEKLDYVDFTADLKLFDMEGEELRQIIPRTARSILTGGEICVSIDHKDCKEETADFNGLLRQGNKEPLPCGNPQPFLPNTNNQETCIEIL